MSPLTLINTISQHQSWDSVDSDVRKYRGKSYKKNNEEKGSNISKYRYLYIIN